MRLVAAKRSEQCIMVSNYFYLSIQQSRDRIARRFVAPQITENMRLLSLQVSAILPHSTRLIKVNSYLSPTQQADSDAGEFKQSSQCIPYCVTSHSINRLPPGTILRAWTENCRRVAGSAQCKSFIYVQCLHISAIIVTEARQRFFELNVPTRFSCTRLVFKRRRSSFCSVI